MVTPMSLDWFGPPDREAGPARFEFPEALPRVDILYAYAGMDAASVDAARGAAGVVLAGLGNGNAPAAVLDALCALGIPVVRSTRVDHGSVDRNLEVDDDACGFVAARALGPAKARILLQVLLANEVRGPAALQAEFDRR